MVIPSATGYVPAGSVLVQDDRGDRSWSTRIDPELHLHLRRSWLEWRCLWRGGQL